MKSGKQSVSVRCIGIGDGWPCPIRQHAAFLYTFPGQSLLVDCGDSVCDRLKEADIGFDDIDGIFISHMHCDHVGGFFMLMQGFWLEQRTRDLKVFLPRQGIEPLRNMLDTGCIFAELLTFKAALAPLRSGRTVKLSNTRITPFRGTHLASLRRQFRRRYPKTPFEAYGFLIEHGPWRIGHSGDIGSADDLEPLLRKPLDLLVCEVAHTKPEDLFEALRGRRIGRVVFVHLARALWENRPQLRRLAARMLGPIPFQIARSGEVIQLP